MILPDQHYLARAGVRPDTAAKYGPAMLLVCSKFEISSRELIAAFVAETLHETTMLGAMEEGTNYSAERLMVVWPKRFSNHIIADQYAHSPRKLCNFVYGDRNGNLGSNTNDGFDFRGSGFLQMTGRSNFAAASRLIGTDYLTTPDLARTVPIDCAMTGGAFWQANKLSEAFAIGGINAVSKGINPGQGKDQLAKRQALYNRCVALT